MRHIILPEVNHFLNSLLTIIWLKICPSAMNKASGGDGIPVESFQILKDDSVKGLHKFRKLSSGHRSGKSQFSFQFHRRAMPMDVQGTTQLHSFHMLER